MMDSESKSPSPSMDTPPRAILPPAIRLSITQSELSKARQMSLELSKAYKDLKAKVDPETGPAEERPELSRKDGLELAMLGTQLALQQKDELLKLRETINLEYQVGNITNDEAQSRQREVKRRYFSAGDDLWRSQRKRIQYDDAGVVRALQPRFSATGESLLFLYQKLDGQSKTKRRPSQWRKNANDYYTEGADLDGVNSWCHVVGPCLSEDVQAAHIVPFFLNSESIAELLFGSRAPDIRRAGNCFLLSTHFERWYDSGHIVIVPVDATEMPIMRWKMEIISNHIRKAIFGAGKTVREYDGKELKFLNSNRPVTRFVYFHFIMTLVRIKDLNRDGWRDIWAKYYQQRPFPTPGPYIRRSMLLALATHFGAADMDVINSWIRDNGFDSPLKLEEDEAMEAARRVYLAVEEATDRANKDLDDSSSSLKGSDDDD